MEAIDVTGILDELGNLEFRDLAPFNEGRVGCYWTDSGTSPWERHPDTDELLLVLEGSVRITVLPPAGGRESVEVRTGHLVVVPRGHWHRHEASGRYRELYVTPGASQTSFDDDPREGGG